MSKEISLDDFLQKISNDIEPSKQCGYNKTELESESIKFDFSSFYTGGEIGYYSSDIICRDFLLHRHERGSRYSFLFFNTGENPICFRSDKDQFVLNKGEFWLGTMQSKLRGVHELENKHYKSSCIALSTAFANELGILKNLNLDQAVCMKKFKTSAVQNIILKELENAAIYDGKIREIFMESKILEMLYRSFHKFNEPQNALSLDENRIKTVQKAKKILLENMQNPPSIKELARLCATNEFALKRDFKAYFGTSVYAMLTNERLEIAKELLSLDQISVNEAAKMVGYNNLSHFSKIFRTKFNVLPTQLKKDIKFYYSD